jgi:hypothetical protein
MYINIIYNINNMNTLNNTINNTINNSTQSNIDTSMNYSYNFESDNPLGQLMSSINFDNLEDLNLSYNDELSQVEMINVIDTKSTKSSKLSLKLNDLDVNSIKLDNIYIISNDDVKFGNISLKIGGIFINYPIFEFDIIKTNEGFKIDLTKLKDFGFGDIITKLMMYHQIHLTFEYSGKIDKAFLNYYKSNINDNLSNYLNTEFNLKITNFNLLNVNDNNTLYIIKPDFYFITNKLEIRCNDIENDLENIELKVYGAIYDKYTIDQQLENKIILNFDKYIDFNKISSISIYIKFKNPKERNIIIYNKYYNCLCIKHGMGIIKFINDGYSYGHNNIELLSFNNINNSLINNDIYNIVIDFNYLDLKYM